MFPIKRIFFTTICCDTKFFNLLIGKSNPTLSRIKKTLDPLPFRTMANIFDAHVQIEELRMEIGKRDQELLAMGAKMKKLEEQHQDYQRHIAVLKESLCAKEEHYNMLQTDVCILLLYYILNKPILLPPV